jgi:hypothetical protein
MFASLRSRPRLFGATAGVLVGAAISFSGWAVAQLLGANMPWVANVARDFMFVGLVMAATDLVAGAILAPRILTSRRAMIGGGLLFALVTIVVSGLIVISVVAVFSQPFVLGDRLLALVLPLGGTGIMGAIAWAFLVRSLADADQSSIWLAGFTALCLIGATILLESLWIAGPAVLIS